MSQLIHVAVTLSLIASLTAAAMVVPQAADAADNAPSPGKVLRHVVLFKFKDGTKPDDIERVVKAFGELPKKIDVIQDFEWGTDVSVENKQQGFTHCFFVTFRDAEGRDTYLPHPAHKEFGTIVRPHLDKVLVVDYWSRK